MKRLLALLLWGAMMLNLAACSNSGNTSPAEAPTAAPAQTPTEAPTSPAAPDGTVLVDNEDAAFSVLRTEQSEHAGMQLHVQCVNKGSSALMFSWDMVSVCGYMYDPLWAVEVAGGKTANSIIDLDTYALERMGIASVDEITFTLRIYDSEDWMKPPIVQQVYTIYPTGLSAGTTVPPKRAPREGQVVIADDENIRFVIEGTDTRNDSAYTVQAYIENKTDRNLMFSWDLVSVNGKMVDPLWAVSVAAGKKACPEISFRHSDLEENGITEVSAMEFKLIVSDYDNWDTPNLLEKTYTYTP